MKSLLSNIEQLAGIIRDFGLIIGLPIFFTIIVKLYKHQISILKQQIDVLKQENEVLKSMQYDQALQKIKALRELYEEEIKDREERIGELQKLGKERQNELDLNLKELSNLKYKYEILKHGKNEVDKNIRSEALRKLKIISGKIKDPKCWIEEHWFSSGTYGDNVNPNVA